jgi:hypothetical protein
MAVVSLTIKKIRECVLRLIESTKAQIPELPKETWGIDHHYISEAFEQDGEQFIFALRCTPPLKKDEMKKMMLSCVVCFPANGIETERPIMYEYVDTLLATIDSEEIIAKITKDFEALIQDAKDFDPYERSDFDWD